MKKIKVLIGIGVASILVIGGLVFETSAVWYGTSPAAAATAEQKVLARKDLDQVIATLRAVDTAYASGNAAEAQTKFAQARSTWNNVASAISAREAREAQLMFDGLAAKLKAGAPPADVKNTIIGMVEELSEDIAGELR